MERQIAFWRAYFSREQCDPVLYERSLAQMEEKSTGLRWPDDRLTAVVLTLCGPTAAKEFNLYWRLIKAQQRRSWKLAEFRFDDECVHWIKGSENVARDWHFEWQVVDLGAHRDVTIEAMREQTKGPLPSAAILAAGALHPDWIRAINGDDVPYVALPGYEVSVPSSPQLRLVPHLSLDRADGQVGLSAQQCDSTHPYWGVPAFV